MEFTVNRTLLASMFVACWGMSWGQNAPKTAFAQPLQPGEQVVLDGDLNETVWLRALPADEFTQLAPNPDQRPSQPTEVRLAFDDQALYIGARMWDSAPDSILHQLSPRDQTDNTDQFAIWFSTFNDGINAVRFTTTPEGIQVDELLTGASSDLSWNAPWNVSTRIDSAGWTAEFRIPWMAFRFPGQGEQEWGFNCSRTIRRIRETSYWQRQDPTLEGELNQGGVLQGIAGIDPPARISLFPYVSSYANAGAGAVVGSYKGGMDLKLGLGDAFTLDATLVPDFGQVVADNLVLNLSPYEIQFNENRPFFQEGTELFNKAGLFYSRRIGVEDQLLNATKIYGRTADGTGLGLLTAVARDTVGGGDALNQYTVAVVDQNLPNNGFVNATSTLVLHEGEQTDASAHGLAFDVRDPQQRWSVSGSAKINRYHGLLTEGLSEGDAWSLEVRRIKGQWTYGAGHYEESVGYDPNALGFLEAPNEVSTYAWLRWNRYTPKGRWNRVTADLSTVLTSVETPRMFSRWTLEGFVRGTTRAFHTWNLRAMVQPVNGRDVFVSRIPGRHWNEPQWGMVEGWFSSDYRRVFALDAFLSYANGPQYWDWKEHTIRIAPRLRINDRWSTDYVWKVIRKSHERGWAALLDVWSTPTISLFGDRDNTEITQVWNIRHIFNNRMSLSGRVRHSWSRVRYHGFLELNEDGDLVATDWATVGGDGRSEYDLNFNAWSVDLVYEWNFAPASFLTVVWKNNLQSTGNLLPANYGENFNQMLENGFLNSLSLRALFFVDYNRLKSGLRGFDR